MAASSTQVCLDVPHPFDFEATVTSHGWVSLAPNQWNSQRQTLQRPMLLPTGRVVTATIGSTTRPGRPAIEVLIAGTQDLDAAEIEAVQDAVTWMLRLEEDLSEFYQICRRKGGHWTHVTDGSGRLLRSPTLFEDIVRTMLTTNTQWSGTMRMVGAVVDALGPPFPGDSSLKAFPSAQSIASLERAEFEDSVRLGYRGRYIHELARGVARRDLDLDALQSANLSSAELRRRLLSIKGVGPYAASTLAMILGRYDQVAVDSEFRRFVSATYFGGRRVPDSEAVAIYDEWEAWKYLAYWFDLTRRESPPLAAT